MDVRSLWVFGYGSLMWNPGFEWSERAVATLPGYSRSFCMWSIHHRGTEENPGLVLALDEHTGSECHGLAFQVPEEHRDETMAVLRERELVSSAYVERDLQVQLADGRDVEAVSYVIDPHHIQYCKNLSLQDQADVIARAIGGRGPNTEYLFNTADHLQELGIEDEDLSWLAARVREMRSL